MEDYQLLIDLHKGANRQGPGGDAETGMAVDMSMIDRSAPLRVADIGCGTGASTLLLAKLLNAQITAVDFLQDFLEVLEGKSEDMGFSDKISTLCCSMDNLPFGDEEFDVIWSEGAIYNIGFKRGSKDWNRYLKVGGILGRDIQYWLSKRIKRLEPLSESGRNTCCFGDYLDYSLPSYGSSKILG